MSLIAAGAYLRALRERQGTSRAKVAALTGTHESQIERIERGDQDSRASLLFAIVDAVGGKYEDIAQLFRDQSLSVEDGRQLAERRMGLREDSPPVEVQPIIEALLTNSEFRAGILSVYHLWKTGVISFSRGDNEPQA